jgi:methionyl-tRNA formyltransferase
MDMAALSVIFAGSGAFGLPTLRALHASSGIHLVQLVSQPDRPAGRGRKLHSTAISQFAADQGLPLLRTADINRETLSEADVMVVIAFGQKIAENQVHQPRLGSINLHASRLPKYRGAAPINWAILGGETLTGNSVIRLAPKMDAGAILGQSELPIGDLETAGELHDRLAEDGPGLIMRVLHKMAAGRAVEVTQNDAQATSAPKLTRHDAHLDWTRPADELARRIRGLYPWPGCHVRLVDEQGREVNRLTLARAGAQPSGNDADTRRFAPGVICGDGITAGDGRQVMIMEVQPEGKRPMSLQAYLNGHPWHDGMRLESLV